MSERDTNTRRVVLAGGAALAGASLLASPARAQGPLHTTDGERGPAGSAANPIRLRVNCRSRTHPKPRRLPLGERRIVPIVGGTFEGPNIRGKVMPGGADRRLVRKDGVRVLNALYELQTDDGAIITVNNHVLVDDQPGRQRYVFSTLEITAPEGPHAWLNRGVFVGTLNSLRPGRSAVLIRVYKLV